MKKGEASSILKTNVHTLQQAKPSDQGRELFCPLCSVNVPLHSLYLVKAGGNATTLLAAQDELDRVGSTALAGDAEQAPTGDRTALLLFLVEIFERLPTMNVTLNM